MGIRANGRVRAVTGRYELNDERRGYYTARSYLDSSMERRADLANRTEIDMLVSAPI